MLFSVLYHYYFNSNCCMAVIVDVMCGTANLRYTHMHILNKNVHVLTVTYFYDVKCQFKVLSS